MKRILVFSLAFLLVVSPAVAFLYDIKILTREEIQKLSDEELEETYIEARIEEKASQEFHIGAGFSSAKDYDGRKNLLRYIFELRRELGTRKALKAEDIDQFLE